MDEIKGKANKRIIISIHIFNYLIIFNINYRNIMKIYYNNKSFYKNLNPHSAPIIAEIANTHCGDFKKLLKLINIISRSDTSIVKFQIFKTYERAEKNTKDWSIFSKIEFSESK